MLLKEGGGLINLHNNILKKGWSDMCGTLHTPDAVNDKPKIQGITLKGEATNTRRRGYQRRLTRGYTYTEDVEVGTNLCGDTCVIGLCYPRRMCIFDVHVIDTNKESYEGRNPHRIMLYHEQRKKDKYIDP